MTAKILYWDIETAPITAHTWSLRDLNVGLSQVLEEPRMIAFGAKWGHEQKVKFFSEYHNGREEMLAAAHRLLDEADVVVSFNGDSFDTRWVQGELWREGHTPPSPFKSIDLYKLVRKNFRLMSNKLAHVSVVAGLEGKVTHSGHSMWVACLLGDEETKRKAWAKMRTYCKRDVALLEPLLERCRPWLPNQINFALYEGGEVEGLTCQKCGKPEFLVPKGTAYTAQRAYPQVWCKPALGGCGGWTRDNKSSWSVAGVGSQR